VAGGPRTGTITPIDAIPEGGLIRTQTSAPIPLRQGGGRQEKFGRGREQLTRTSDNPPPPDFNGRRRNRVNQIV